MNDLKQKTIEGLKWNFAGRIGMQAIQFLISIILARLLVPAEFGLIAMLSLFMALAASILDSGFGSALIHKQNASKQDESSIFYFNICISLFLFGLLWSLTPWIARFFREPMLVPLGRFLGLNLIINSLGLVQEALMVKRLDFKTQSKVAVIATFVSGAIGVTMALKGFGVWSLAAQSVSSNVARVMLYWGFNSWRPQPSFSPASLRSMFPYGSRLLLSGMLNTIFENAYQVLIGRLYAKSDLGYYTRALTTQRLPVSVITSILSQVAFPAFSSIQEDRPRFKAAYRKAIVLSGFVTFPLMLGLLVAARPLFLLVFTAKWAPSIVFFQFLCLAGMLMPLHALNLSALMALGRSDMFLRLEIVKKLTIAAAILSTYRFGILAMIWGQCVSSILCLVINTHYSGVMIDYPLREQLRDLMPCFLLSGAMAAVVHFASTGLEGSVWLKFAVQIVLGALIYLVGSAALRLTPYFELKKIAVGQLASLKQMVAG